MADRRRPRRLRGRDRKRLEAFVRARTAELTDDRRRASATALLLLVDRLRREATKEADWAWIEAVAIGFLDDEDWADDAAEDAVFGDDPEQQAAAIVTAILAAMALAHADHPDYDRRWAPTGDR